MDRVVKDDKGAPDLEVLKQVLTAVVEIGDMLSSILEPTGEEEEKSGKFKPRLHLLYLLNDLLHTFHRKKLEVCKEVVYAVLGPVGRSVKMLGGGEKVEKVWCYSRFCLCGLIGLLWNGTYPLLADLTFSSLLGT